MLGKLVKDEFKSYRMPFGIMFLGGILFTLFMKVVCMLPYKNDVKETIQLIGFNGYYYVIMLIGFVAMVLTIVRFYQTTVGDRGYLTWTLPVKSSTIIWSKLIGGMIWRLIASVGIAVFLLIFLAGKYWVIWDDFAMELTLNETDYVTLTSILKQLMSLFHPAYLIPVILVVIMALVFMVVSQLLIYFCIAIGQLFGKWRIVASIGFYFLIMIFMEVLVIFGIAALAVGGVSVANLGIFEKMSGIGMISFALTFGIVIGLILSAAFFLLTNMIFSKHLNLE
jgi:hypothetical protein